MKGRMNTFLVGSKIFPVPITSKEEEIRKKKNSSQFPDFPGRKGNKIKLIKYSLQRIKYYLQIKNSSKLSCSAFKKLIILNNK